MPGDRLLAVQVPERHVAEAVEQRGGHLADAADGDVALGVAGRSPGNPAVREHDSAAHTPVVPVGLDHADRMAEHAGVPARRLVAELGPDRVRFQVRHPVDGDLAVLVGQQHRVGKLADPGAQVHAGRVEERAAETEPAGRVVVAADHHYPGPGAVEPEQGILEQRDRVYRRHRAVVHVAGHKNGIHLLRAHGLHEMIEEPGLCRP